MKNGDIFSYFCTNTDYGLLQPPNQLAFNEYLQSMFWSKKKKMTYPTLPCIRRTFFRQNLTLKNPCVLYAKLEKFNIVPMSSEDQRLGHENRRHEVGIFLHALVIQSFKNIASAIIMC